MNKKVKTVNKISEKSEKTTLQSEIKVRKTVKKSLQSEITVRKQLKNLYKVNKKVKIKALQSEIKVKKQFYKNPTLQGLIKVRLI